MVAQPKNFGEIGSLADDIPRGVPILVRDTRVKLRKAEEGIMNTEVASKSHPLLTTLEEETQSEVEHIRPDLRSRLAPLEPQGLLAAGIRAILQENGYAPVLLREHCGCQACAQRCSACAQRYHG